MAYDALKGLLRVGLGDGIQANLNSLSSFHKCCYVLQAFHSDDYNNKRMMQTPNRSDVEESFGHRQPTMNLPEAAEFAI